MARLRATRDATLVNQRLEALRSAAADDRNIIPAMLDCARAYCTLYEIRHVLEEIYGSYREPVFF
jgi:methylmalonyl-CoA mutase, N-terminal domain